MNTRRGALAILLAVVLGGCGHRADRTELVEANSVAVVNDGASADAAASPSATSEADGAPSPTGPDQPGADAPGPSTGSTAAGTPTGAAPTQQAGGTTCRAKSTVPIVIGSVGNYSGPAGSSLRPTALTVQAWAQWINQRGGLCGRRVQVAVVDDHSDPAQYRAAVQDLVENRGAVAFINAASLTGAAGIEYLERVRVPAIGGGCAVEAEYRSPMYFLVCAPPADQYYGAARNAVLFGPESKKFGLVTCREVEVCGAAARRELLERNGVKRAGAELVYEAQASITQPDFTAECRGAANAGAASVSLMLDAASVRRFGQSCARQGYEPVFSQISATVVNDTKDYPGLGKLLVALPVFSFASASTPAQQEFQDVMSQLYDGKPGPAEGLGWASAKLLELAATKAVQASGDLTPASLIAALQQLQDETVGGLTIPLTFTPDKPGAYPACWFAVRAEDGTWSTLNDGKPVCR